jgi:hypothetical protein
MNKDNLIICNIKVGGQSISLHDKYGRPRVSLIVPSFSSIDLLQSLGRIHRAGSKSPALQRIIYCSNTCEEVISRRLNSKIEFLSKINDDDLSRTGIIKYEEMDKELINSFKKKYNL